MATVQDILEIKGDQVFTIDDKATVLEATIRMNLHKIGGVVVTDSEGCVAGIFTERDVLRRVVAEQKDPVATSIREVMTAEVICCKSSTDLHEVQAMMKSQRIRHLPTVDDQGKLVGMISIGDVNGHFATSNEVHIQYLNDYIMGRA